MYEESQLSFSSKIYEFMNSTTYEKYNKYPENITKFKDQKTAKSLGLYDISPDCRKIYRSLLKDIENMKDPEGKEIDYIEKIQKLLWSRRAFLLKEIEDNEVTPPEKSLIDADEFVVKLAHVYMELFRTWTFIIEKFNHLEKVNCIRKELEPAMVKHIARYMPEHLFRMQYKFLKS